MKHHKERPRDPLTPEQQELVAANIRLVPFALRYIRPGTVRRHGDDLLSAGYDGLMRAAQLYDPTRGTQFSTVAMIWIRQRFGRVLEVLRINEERMRPVSLHQLFTSKDGSPAEFPISDVQPAQWRTAWVKEMLAKAKRRLHTREWKILELRFMHKMTLDEVGAILGCTRERIRQLEVRTLDKVREYLAAWERDIREG